MQEVVERSGQSLRSFYQYFAGKHELLLALFEESVRSTAEQLARPDRRDDDPLERLHRFTSEYYRVCRPSRARARSRPTPAMADFAPTATDAHPKEAALAFAPLVPCSRSSSTVPPPPASIRAGLDHRRITGVVLAGRHVQRVRRHDQRSTVERQSLGGGPPNRLAVATLTSRVDGIGTVCSHVRRRGPLDPLSRHRCVISSFYHLRKAFLTGSKGAHGDVAGQAPDVAGGVHAGRQRHGLRGLVAPPGDRARLPRPRATTRSSGAPSKRAAST